MRNIVFAFLFLLIGVASVKAQSTFYTVEQLEEGMSGDRIIAFWTYLHKQGSTNLVLKGIRLDSLMIAMDSMIGSGGGSDDWGTQVVETDATLDGDGTVGTELKIAQQGATSGQILKWNGSTWAPAADDTGGAGGGENNIGQNLGSGTGVYAGKTDTTLQFKSLIEGYGINFSNTGTEITVNSDTSELVTPYDISLIQADIDAHELLDEDLSPTNEIQNLSYTPATGVIAIDGLGSTDATIPVMTASVRGLVPDGDGSGIDEFLREDGTWAVPPATSTDLTIGGAGPDYTIESNTGTDVTISGNGITLNESPANTLIFTATDPSLSNEGVLGVGAGSGTSATFLSTTSGANPVTINAAGILAITESTSANGGSITLTATEVGTVSNFSAGDLSPLFTTSEATTTSTPALTFALSNAAANTYFGNATGGAAAPSFTAAGSLTAGSSKITIGTGTNTLLANATVDVNEANLTIDNIPANQIAYGTGTGITSSYTAKSGVLQSESGNTYALRTSGSGLGADSCDVSIGALDAVCYNSGAGNWQAIYLDRETGTGDIYMLINNKAASTTADAYIAVQVASGGGDPYIKFAGFAAGTASIGIDNSDSDLYKLDYGNGLDGTYAVSMNSSNEVGIKGAPISGKALAITGELQISDLTAATTATQLIGAGPSGEIEAMGLGSGFSIVSGALTYTETGTGSGTVTSIEYVAPAAGVTISGTTPVTTTGTWTFGLANDLAAIEGLSGTGIAVRTALDTWTTRSLAAPAAGFTITNDDGVSGNPTFVLADDLAGLEGMSGTGIVARTASNTYAQRTITAGTGISIADGNGVSGNPTVTADTVLLATIHDVTLATSGMITGSGAAGQVTHWLTSNTVTGSNNLFYDAATIRFGINTNAPTRKLDIVSASGSEAGVLVRSDGTIDQDVTLFEIAGVGAGPYTQRVKLLMDVYTNGGALPDGHALLFQMSRDGGPTTTPLALYSNQAIMNNASSFTVANNTGELRLAPASASQVRMYHTVLVTGAAFGTLDTVSRFRVFGRTQTSSTYSGRFYDGNAQSILDIRDDRRVGILTSSPNRTLEVNGEVRITDLSTDLANGIVATDNDGDLSKLKLGTNLSISNDTLNASGGAGVTDHGALTGLGDDDHSQYALLAGRSGGQSLTGGTGSSENLTLNSTSDATKGAILIGTDNSKSVIGASVYFRADIAPTALSADTDNWNPAGLDTASTIRISATDTVNLTGLQGGTDGRIIYLYNIGEFSIILKSNTTSTSAYRFYFDGDIELKFNQGIILQYDAASSKWRAAGSTTWARSSVTYEYTSAQTNAALTVPTGTKALHVLCVGAGGGGGGGRRGAAGSIRSGGGGGASGGVSFGTFSMASLNNPTTLYINLGDGGTAGAAATTDDTNGGNGGSSADSDVRTTTGSGDRFITANAGNFGTGGDNNGSNGGGAASGALFSNSAGAASSATGAAGTVSTASNFVNGGGSGGGLTTGNASSAGGNGGSACMGMYSTLNGGAGGTSGSDGATRTLTPSREYGQGGAGGGSGSAGIGGNGGAGIRGGGGGGGGASVNGNNSGAGGVGGPGYVKIIFFF